MVIKDGKLYMLAGANGGPNIISSTLEVTQKIIIIIIKIK
jgi:gamma-glutamyltranspeptidase